MIAALLPCPFCGADDAQTDFIEGESYLVECSACHAETGICDSAQEAIDAWNRRARTAAPQVGAERPTQAAPFEAFLRDDDARALHRFMECCEDSDSGGHDVSKNAMRRLAKIGVVRSCGFGRHEITAFGRWVHDGAWLEDVTLPLATYAEMTEAATRAAKEAT